MLSGEQPQRAARLHMVGRAYPSDGEAYFGAFQELHTQIHEVLNKLVSESVRETW
jgi:hypothetical protein